MENRNLELGNGLGDRAGADRQSQRQGRPNPLGDGGTSPSGGRAWGMESTPGLLPGLDARPGVSHDGRRSSGTSVRDDFSVRLVKEQMSVASMTTPHATGCRFLGQGKALGILAARLAWNRPASGFEGGQSSAKRAFLVHSFSTMGRSNP